MRVIESVAELRQARASAGLVGLVPTMGYLHEGHLSLLRAARSRSDTVVMSLFVNPAQFGPHEDFASYPRDQARDLALAEGAGTDIVFMPPTEAVYPAGFNTWIDVGDVTARWEGEARPGHFRGVATVVLKLFQMSQPDYAYFGEKDYQQLQVVQKMVRELDVPVVIVPCPTVREASGLALSSRNAYLSDEQRQRASVLHRALTSAQQLAASGERSTESLLAAMKAILATEPAARPEYLAIVDPITLEPIVQLTGKARILAAMRFHNVRLIDNVELESPS